MKKAFILAAALAAAFSGSAAAFHPLVTDDTVMMGLDGRQIRSGILYSVSRQGPDRYSTGAFTELSYGLFSGVDVMITVPWQGWSSHGIAKSGLGDVLVETKFPAGRRSGWNFALKPGFSLPAGNEAQSLGAGKGGVWTYLVGDRKDGPRRYYFNAGYRFNNNSVDMEKHLFKASAAGALELLPKTTLSAELSLETSPVKESVSHPAYSLLGFTWSPYSTLDLDAGARLGLTRAADDFGLLASLTLRL